MQVEEYIQENYVVSTDSSKLDLKVIHGYLSRSYWAEEIPFETVKRSVEHSLCFGVYTAGKQIGFARVISDYTTFAYLADVFILEEERGKGLSKFLMECILKHIKDSIPAIRAFVFNGLYFKKADSKLLKEIQDRHKYDSAKFVERPTDLVISWKVIEYMETIFKWKIEKMEMGSQNELESRLKNVNDRIQNKIRIKIPGEYHGLISKEHFLCIDSLQCTVTEYRIKSFNLNVEGQTFIGKNRITKEMKDSIRHLKTGGKLTFEEILIETIDKKLRRIGSFNLEIS